MLADQVSEGESFHFPLDIWHHSVFLIKFLIIVKKIGDCSPLFARVAPNFSLL